MAGKSTWTPEEETKLRVRYLEGLTSHAIAGEMGRTKASVDTKIARMRLPELTKERPARGEQLGHDTYRRKEDDSGLIYEGQTTKPIRKLDDLLEVIQPDLATWRVKDWECRTWEMGYKDTEGKGQSLQLWSYNAKFERKKGWTPEEVLVRLRQELSGVPKTQHRRIRQPSKGVLCEISIVDHHFGKLGWAPEVGEDYDLKIAEKRYTEASDFLLSRAAERKPDRILIVAGNDFYHVDRGSTNSTNADTRQDVDGRWQKAYVTGSKCLRNTVAQAAEIAPTDLVVVPGNHDTEKMFTVGHAMELVFEDDGRVQVDNTPTLKKSFKWGNVFLGFYHGHECNQTRRERIIREFEGMPGYAAARWREIHLGHIHSEHEKVWEYRSAETIHKVVVRVLPSLSGTDKWHHTRGYDAPRAAEMHVYDSARGRIGMESFVEKST